jgi:hypothetical protein
MCAALTREIVALLQRPFRLSPTFFTLIKSRVPLDKSPTPRRIYGGIQPIGSR